MVDKEMTQRTNNKHNKKIS